VADILTYIHNYSTQLGRVILFCGVFLLIERIYPVQRHQPLKHIFFNFQWIAFYLLLNQVLSSIPAIAQGMAQIKKLIGGPYLSIAFPENILGQVASWFLYLFILDFFYYWLHRFQHKVPFLWAQHQFHHSEIAMNTTTGHRHYWTEGLLAGLFIWMPANALLAIPTLNMTTFLFFVGCWNFFVHMNLRIEFGRLSAWIGGPQLHRIHHSYSEQHIDKNFAPYFPIWDVIFGTYYHPQTNEFPATGLTSHEQILTLWDANILPLRGSIKRLAKGFRMRRQS
jgi:sterol desaturase/sphingolipid hydroxylase (fatty acid hydroxylase superfamily)